MRKIGLVIKYLKTLRVKNFCSYIIQRYISRHEIISINVKGLQEKVNFRNAPSDIQIFTQIFILKEYDISIEKPIFTIIDCGANIGLATLYFLTKFPSAKIIAVEPELQNFKMLQMNLAHYPNVICINKGIWSRKCVLEIIDNGWGSAGFIIKEVDEMNESTIEAISISDLFSQFDLNKVDILKIDIEGSEDQLFFNNIDWIKNVKMIFCEIHENLKPGLTNKIITSLNDQFEISKNGEYHIFKSKSKVS